MHQGRGLDPAQCGKPQPQKVHAANGERFDWRRRRLGAAYAARYLAKNVVAAGLAERCTIQVAYAIGVADPMSVLVDTHGTGQVEESKLEKVLPELFRLTPTNIRRTLKLNRPIYQRTASYGHFGRAPDRDGGFSWEQ